MFKVCVSFLTLFQGHSDLETDHILLESVPQVFLFIYFFHFYTHNNGNITVFIKYAPKYQTYCVYFNLNTLSWQQDDIWI